MTRLSWLRTQAVCIAATLSGKAVRDAQNPIIQTDFTADPAPLVYKGSIYLYTSYDADQANVDSGSVRNSNRWTVSKCKFLSFELREASFRAQVHDYGLGPFDFAFCYASTV